MNLKQKVMSGLRWSAGMKLLGQLITWVVTIMVIRLLTPADYGLMGLAGVFVAFLTMISDWGLGAVIVHRRDLDLHDLRVVSGFVLFFSLMFCVILFVGAPFISGFYGESQLELLIRALALAFLLTGLSVLPRSLLLRDMEYRKIAIVEFVSAISTSVTTLIFAYNGMGVWSLVAGYLVRRFVLMVGFQFAKPFLWLPHFSVKGMKPILAYSGYVTLAQIFWQLYSHVIPTLIVGKVLGKEILGFYGVGLYLASLPMEKVSALINQVAFPAFSSIQAEPFQAGQHFLKAVRVLSFIAFPIFLGISVVGTEIVEIFLGEKWSQAIVPLQIIAFVIPLRMVRNLIQPALMGLGRADVCLMNEIVAMALMPLSFLIATYGGLIGVCLVWVVIFPIVFALNLLQVVRVFGLKFQDVLSAMLKPALSGVIMYVCVQLIKNGAVMNYLVSSRLALFMLCGAVVYACMTLFVNRKGFLEIRELLKV